MKIITLLFSTFWAVFLMASSSALAQNSIQINKNGVVINSGNSGMNSRTFSTYTNQQYNSSSQYQSSAITLSASNLRRPNILSVTTAPGTKLTGKITVNGVVVKTLNTNRTSVNLSPYLSRGKKTVEISGSYKPTSSSVNIEFSGPNTKVSQQTSNNGTLRQTLIITVR